MCVFDYGVEFNDSHSNIYRVYLQNIDVKVNKISIKKKLMCIKYSHILLKHVFIDFRMKFKLMII